MSLTMDFKRWEWGDQPHLYKWQGMLYHDGAMVKTTRMHSTRYEAKVELRDFLGLVREKGMARLPLKKNNKLCIY